MQSRNSFNSLRLFGALIVLIGHAFIITGAEAPKVGAIALHSFGVCIFFAISGYLITQSWISDPTWHRFLLRRSLRVFPALVIVCGATAILIGPLATTEPLGIYFHHGWTWRYIMSNSVLLTVWGLPGVFDALPIHGQANGSLWTLPIEFGLYLLVPLMILGRTKTSRASDVILLIAAIVVVIVQPILPAIFQLNFAV